MSVSTLAPRQAVLAHSGFRRILRVRASIGDELNVLSKQHARSVVLDVEPLVCRWRTDQAALDDGLSATIVALANGPGITHVAFSTNSKRVPGALPTRGTLVATYQAHARKPWSYLGELRALPRPVVVLGDQPLTDGLLAWRLNATFVQLELPSDAPLFVRLQARLGELLRLLVFSS